MTPIADMVERMLADGVTAELVVLAIRAVETMGARERDDERYASRYASHDVSRFVTAPSTTPGAIRARKSRANRKQNQPSAKANDVADSGAEVAHAECDTERDASRDGVTSAPTFLSSFSSCEEGLTEKEVSKKSKKEQTENARARGQRMAAGAILIDEWRTAAIELGADPSQVPEMWAEHVDYWIGVPGQRGVKLDWLATWRNDVRRKLKMGPRNNGHRQQSLGDLARDIAGEIREREREIGAGRSPHDVGRR